MNSATLSTPLPTPLATPVAPSLKEMMEDGVYLLFLLRNGNPPATQVEFNKRVDGFLATFEKNARNFGNTPEAIHDAKYAFCALMDEIVLSSDFAIRDDWERAPLQLRLFGEHLAGEGFFDKLETLRLNPDKNVQTLEVFHTCLILGFQGRYLLEGTEKLSYLIARLSQEIAHARGGIPEFAPHWKLPFRFNDYVRHELPLWLYFALLSGVAVVIFLLYHWILGGQSDALSAAVMPPPANTQPTNQPNPAAPTL